MHNETLFKMFHLWNSFDAHSQYVVFLFTQADEYQRMTKDVNRSAYTRRILEIVANIRKQKEDIEKVS